MVKSHVVSERTQSKRFPNVKGKNQSLTKGKRPANSATRGRLSGNDEEDLNALIVPSSSTEAEDLEVENIGESKEDEDKKEKNRKQNSSKGETPRKKMKKSTPEEELEKDKETKSQRKKKNKKEKKEEEKEDGGGDDNSDDEGEKSCSALHKFPMNRISRIIRSENSNIRISQEAIFIINKASEKFLETFSREAYAGVFLDHKTSVGYKHLSSVVSKRRRFDFLSDFVPEKVKAKDALAQMSIPESEQTGS